MSDSKPIQFFSTEKFHAKQNIGSTRIRVYNLIKYWSEASLYRYGDNPDVMIYQKVYTTFDWKFQEHFKGIQVLDICDPDFRDSPDLYVRHTMDLMDAVVCPTETFAKFLRQMTTTPVHVIKDRFDLAEFPKPKIHKGSIKTAVWFGYSHNSESIKFAIPSLERRGIKLVVVSNEDPTCYRWAEQPKEYEQMYTFIKFKHPEAYQAIQKGDVCLMLDGYRPMDIFKSENRTVQAKLLGIPIVKTADDIEALKTAEVRNETIQKDYAKLIKDYDCQVSVDEYKNLIEGIRRKRTHGDL